MTDKGSNCPSAQVRGLLSCRLSRVGRYGQNNARLIGIRVQRLKSGYAVAVEILQDMAMI